MLHAKALTNSPAVETRKLGTGFRNEGITSYNVYYGTQFCPYDYSQSFDGSLNDVIVTGSGWRPDVLLHGHPGVDQYGNQSPYSNEVSAKTVKPAPMMLQTQVYLDGLWPETLCHADRYPFNQFTVTGRWIRQPICRAGRLILTVTALATETATMWMSGYSIDPTQPPMFFRAINY